MESITSGEYSVYFCPKCGDENDERFEKVSYDKKAIEMQNQVNRNLSNAMIAPRFRDRTLQNYEATLPGQKKALESAWWFLENMKTCSGMFLIGGPGTGKNHIAAGIVNEYMKTPGRTALMTEAVKVVRSIKETWHKPGSSETEVLRLYNKPDLLIIDEIGVQFESKTERLYLTEIINDRYNCIRPTIICGNLSIGEITEILGERVVDRFRDGGRVVVFDWVSYRKQSRRD